MIEFAKRAVLLFEFITVMFISSLTFDSSDGRAWDCNWLFVLLLRHYPEATGSIPVRRIFFYLRPCSLSSA